MKKDVAHDSLAKALDIIELFRSLDENMPIQQAAVFLTVAMHDEISQKDIAELAHLGQGSASRNVAAFLGMNRFKRKGHDLISAEPDPMELRKKKHRLNAKGKAFAKRIIDIIERDQ